MFWRTLGACFSCSVQSVKRYAFWQAIRIRSIIAHNQRALSGHSPDSAQISTVLQTGQMSRHNSQRKYRRHVLRNRRKALKIKVFRWQYDKLTTNLRQLPTKKRRDMYEATACILQAVAFSLQKRYFYNLISLLAVEKNELKRVKNMI